MNDCPKHPGQNTMVPCLGCGRSFCRICDAPKGAGQYCPACYREQVERLQEKSATDQVSAPAEETPGGRSRIGRGRKPKKDETDSDPRRRGALLAPFHWIDRKVVAAGGALKRAALYCARLPKRAALFVAWCARWLWRQAKDHWPLSLAPRELMEGNPPFGESWWKLLLFMAGGILLWTILVTFTGVRNPGFSIGVAILVSGGVIWAMGSKYGPTTGVVCAGLVLVSLVVAELLVQILFRAGVIHKLDLQLTGLISLEKPRTFYGTFLFRLITYRLLPSAIVAFLVGWWPLKRRLAWFGFGGRGIEPLEPRVKRDEKPHAEAPRPVKAKRWSDRDHEKKLRVKEKPAGALSRKDLENALDRQGKPSSEEAATDPEA